ncbi:hypothetical protein E4T66_05190 [Sinimarinibacterium sp. CAU 1509]|uniref:hypothetical protein n=1 Tax=Sinimarinibacterium sp. CAU 1509 TaxID=2562283 RepID=UPI0010ACC719|nr:hypothetical protein [Sinimarinibacterium sp. CAU 1509]TJY63107.1 hypothetical protein E4T66_05190 [Sinimarinibacterium sp. CAU 1509]
MSGWFALNLGDAMLAGPELERIASACTEAWKQHAAPDSLAVYFRHETDGGLHCSVKVYFPPAATAIARTFGAAPCPPPAADSLGLLAGSRSAKDVLFAGIR